jgi:uncharacterized damage-inducible protein DinB
MPSPEEAGFRTDPPFVAPEREMLEAWLDYHRGTLLWKCDGLSDDELTNRSVEPSTLSLIGLVRHMADVERWWFRIRAAQLDLDNLYSTDESPDGDFDLVDASTVQADLAIYRAEIEAARAAVADLSLDATFPHHRRQVDMSVRWVFLHMIEEYARHNGHADLIRERIDGRTGD